MFFQNSYITTILAMERYLCREPKILVSQGNLGWTHCTRKRKLSEKSLFRINQWLQRKKQSLARGGGKQLYTEKEENKIRWREKWPFISPLIWLQNSDRKFLRAAKNVIHRGNENTFLSSNLCSLNQLKKLKPNQTKTLPLRSIHPKSNIVFALLAKYLWMVQLKWQTPMENFRVVATTVAWAMVLKCIRYHCNNFILQVIEL